MVSWSTDLDPACETADTAMPRVSVIVPAHNSAQWIGRAVGSVLSQTESNLEVIVVDDASVDTTRQVLDQIDDARLRVVYLDENLGAATARNHGIAAARGEWIGFLDSDDWFGADRLSTLLDVARQWRSDVVSDDLLFIDSDASRPWTSQLKNKRLRISGPMLIEVDDFMRLDLAFKPLVRTAFLRRHALGFPDGYRAEDWFLWLKILLAGARWIQIPYGAYYYSARPGSQMTRPLGGSLHQQALIELLIDEQGAQLDPTHVASLKAKLAQVKSRVAYYRFVIPLKAGRLVEAMRAARHAPEVWKELADRVPGAVRSRLERLYARLRSPPAEGPPK